MGADLCGYLLSGPTKLDRIRVAKAKAIHASIREHLDDDPEDFMKFLGTVSDAGPSRGKVYITIEFGDGDEARAGMDTIAGFPESLVDQFVGLWEGDGGSFRDVTTRDDPFSLKRKLMFAGRMTWGDGPDPDSAWGICEMMDKLGLLWLLGVK